MASYFIYFRSQGHSSCSVLKKCPSRKDGLWKRQTWSQPCQCTALAVRPYKLHVSELLSGHGRTALLSGLSAAAQRHSSADQQRFIGLGHLFKSAQQSTFYLQGSSVLLIRLPIWTTKVSLNWLPATAKSLQSCPTLSDPIPRILQARTLEWVAISFSNA